MANIDHVSMWSACLVSTQLDLSSGDMHCLNYFRFYLITKYILMKENFILVYNSFQFQRKRILCRKKSTKETFTVFELDLLKMLSYVVKDWQT